MKKKFLGHCQGCGRLHKVPSGLAKHGYTVEDWGFNGVCFGAHHEPYEHSCELVKETIVKAKEAIVNLNEEIAEVRELNGVHAYVVYNVPSKHFGAYAVERFVEIKEEAGQFGVELSYFNEDLQKIVDFKIYQFAVRPKSAVELAKELNNKKIQRLQQAIAKQELYIEFQQKRVEEWVYRELIEVDEEPEVIEVPLVVAGVEKVVRIKVDGTRGYIQNERLVYTPRNESANRKYITYCVFKNRKGGWDVRGRSLAHFGKFVDLAGWATEEEKANLKEISLKLNRNSRY